jgi:hypothetical protein
MSVLIKDPDALLDYSVDWEAEGYLLEGEALESSSWLIEPSVSPEELAIDDQFVDGNVATIVVSGGVVGHRYKATNRIVTDAGREDDRSIIIRVEHQ